MKTKLFLVAIVLLTSSAEANGPDLWSVQSGPSTVSASWTRQYVALNGFQQLSVWVPWPEVLANSGELSQQLNMSVSWSPYQFAGQATYVPASSGYTPGWWVTWAFEEFGGTYEVTVTLTGTVTAASDGINEHPTLEPGGGWSVPTEMVQSGNQQIAEKADQLWNASANASDFVYRVIQWVSSNVAFQCPGSRDALTAFTTRTGTCEGMTNLCLALLRAKDVPCGFACGISLTGEQAYTSMLGPSVTTSSPAGLHGRGLVWWDETWVTLDPTVPSYGLSPPQMVNMVTHTDSKQTTPWAWFWGGPYVMQPMPTVYGACTGTAVTTGVQAVSYNRPSPCILQVFSFAGPSVGVEKDPSVESLPIWPNPSSGRFQIAPGATLYDASGRLLWNGKGKQPNLSSGVYFARTPDGRKENFVIAR